MGLIELNNPIEGALGPYRSDGVPDAGTSEIQKITFTDTWDGGDTFTLKYGEEETTEISWSSTAGTLTTNIKNALNALDGIGADGVAVATSGTDSTVTFADKAPHELITVGEVTVVGDGTVDVALDTAGEYPQFYGAPKGALVVDTATGKLYSNTGTPEQPIWTVTGTQT